MVGKCFSAPEPAQSPTTQEETTPQTMPTLQFVILELLCKEQSPKLSTLQLVVSIFKDLSKKFPWNHWNYSCAAKQARAGGASLSCLRIRISLMSIHPKHWAKMTCEILIKNKRPEGSPRCFMKNKLWSLLSKAANSPSGNQSHREPQLHGNHSTAEHRNKGRQSQGSSTW